MEEYLWSVWHIVSGFIIYMDATDRQDQAVWREDRRRIKSPLSVCSVHLCTKTRCAPGGPFEVCPACGLKTIVLTEIMVDVFISWLMTHYC